MPLFAFPGKLLSRGFLRPIHQSRHRKLLTSWHFITTNQRLSPTFRGNGNYYRRRFTDVPSPDFFLREEGTSVHRLGKKCLCLLSRENSYPGVFCDLFTNHDTGNYLRHGILLQPIRGCPQHSGETGTQLSSAIHRRPLSRFFPEGGGDVCTQANARPFFGTVLLRFL